MNLVELHLASSELMRRAGTGARREATEATLVGGAGWVHAQVSAQFAGCVGSHRPAWWCLSARLDFEPAVPVCLHWGQ